ncbi:hypothetical protein AJ79_03241 [Helicocarpus griseus UAMH5409]|uniref:molybdopterin adenylyltransferase n=1 Tax=Helicocarpus griseus UAMH5409 TaxID=1447875 RepID=A0A2B7XQT2_9EURO|nr:hypothetical protein AJ79_03241 [Helicocarpus griseus UAMH5409]
MDIPYDEAISIIKAEAAASLQTNQRRTETVPLNKALSRISKDTHLSPLSTPRWDTSAMDGYALSSKATQRASDLTPAIFAIKATIAAGDKPLPMSGKLDFGVYPCAEIMTGARFPESTTGEPFDCCVRLEDTLPSLSNGRVARKYKCIQTMKPARSGQNKRRAGEDFQEGDVILDAGDVIRPPHIMALASVGIKTVNVLCKPRVGVFSTGYELLPDASASVIPDANGPYICATLEEQGYNVEYLGVIEDISEMAAFKILSSLRESPDLDMIITTGGVSAGKFDVVREALEANLNASVLFHRVAMRPGHPALFARIPEGTPLSWTIQNCNGESSCAKVATVSSRKVAFFGLPGNPVASAACLQFLAMPFLRTLNSAPDQPPVPAIVRSLEKHNHGEIASGSVSTEGVCDGGASLVDGAYTDTNPLVTCPTNKDVFRPGKLLSRGAHGMVEVGIIADHSPGKVSPFLGADCWVHVRQGRGELRDGDGVDVYPLLGERGLWTRSFSSGTKPAN